MAFGDYLGYMINDIPQEVYNITALLFIVGCCIILYVQGLKRGWRSVILLLTLEYIFLLLGSTVLYRHKMEMKEYNFTPFWSYFKIANGDETRLIYENFMNVMVFIPLGFLLGIISSVNNIKIIAIIGCLLSLFIEIMQFVFAKGFSEVDDVIHNTLGCVVGYSIYLLILKVWKRSMNYCGSH